MSDRRELHQIEARSLRLIGGNWMFWGAMAWVTILFFAILRTGGLLAPHLGFKPGLNTMVIEMVVLIALPVGLVMAWHLRKQAAKNRTVRQVFLRVMSGKRLVTHKYNPMAVYQVLDEIDGRLHVLAIWNAEGPVRDGETFTQAPDAFAPFDANAFLTAAG